MHPLCSRLVLFKSLCNRYDNLILASKKQYYSNLVSSSSDNPRRLWQTINELLHRNSSSPLPTCTSASALTDNLASFFTDKISKLCLWPVVLLHNHLRIHLLLRKHPLTSPVLSLLLNLKSLKSYSTVPTNNVIPYIPTWLLKECSVLLVSTIVWYGIVGFNVPLDTI